MLLLLAGTKEARDIAEYLATTKIKAQASLAGVTRQPMLLKIPTRHGGFGGQAGFEAYLRDNCICAVLDATHPFASHMSVRTAKVTTAKGLPYCQVLRPAWMADADDNWTGLDHESEAAKYIPKGAVVFLATGRQCLPGFSNLSGRRLICRRIDPPRKPFPFENGEYLLGTPPFSVADEVALFKRLNIDYLVVKNAGGQSSATKLIAARELGIPVMMIRRPPQPGELCVETVDQAISWIDGLTCLSA